MLTVVWALLIFDEDLSGVQWLGVALVLGGLLVLNARGAVVDSGAQHSRLDRAH